MKNLVKMMSLQINGDEDASKFEAEVTDYLNQGWRIVAGSVRISGDILAPGWNVSCMLVKHPHFVTNG
jgi:hypothetical protein